MTRKEKIRKVIDSVLWTRIASEDNKKILTDALIKALKQEYILEKAICEIDKVGCICHASDNYDELIRKNTVLKILNKYKTESEK